MEDMIITTQTSRFKVLYYRLWALQYKLRKAITRKIKMFFYNFEMARRKSF
ncbi:MAG: hypothetical protein J6J22_07095 [Alistipes sp.]|nr:hypothetical protein [Alistipes sp.]MBP3644399.1 hypothetical protein [Alistipes sp.]